MTNTSWWNQTSPSSLINRCCLNEWMYEDVSVTVHMSCPALLCIRYMYVYEPSLNYVLYQTGVKEDGNLKRWCVVQHDEEHITTYLGYRYVLCHNPALEHRYMTGQYWYVSYWPKYSSDISIYCYPIITLQQLVVALQYWTPLSVQTLEQRHLSTRLHSSHTPAEICDCWTSMNNYWWHYKPCGFKGHWYLPMHVAVGRWQLAMWPRSDLIRKKDIVSIYPRCWVTDENVILLRWWPFWKWCQIGSPSQFGDCGIHFSCWYRSQWQNKTGFHTFLAGACGVHWAHGPINIISVDFKDSHFEFRVNQYLTKSHMDWSVSSLDSSSRKTWV